MRVAWLTDIHLNFVEIPTWARWIEQIRSTEVDGLAITGDISESEDVTWQLIRIYEALRLPVYFVLGNHDFYHGAIGSVRQRVRELAEHQTDLYYLTDAEPVPLTDGWVAVGHDGWGDGREGNYWGTDVRMADFQLIADLQGQSREDRYRFLGHLGTLAAEGLRKSLLAGVQQAKRILILTHVPPFVEACWYQGRTSHPDWLPFFTCQAVGQMMLEIANQNPTNDFLILCGHTHHAGKVQLKENLRVWTGAAEYGVPSIVEVIELDSRLC